MFNAINKISKKEWDNDLLKIVINQQPPNNAGPTTNGPVQNVNNPQMTELMTTMINATINKKP